MTATHVLGGNSSVTRVAPSSFSDRRAAIATFSGAFFFFELSDSDDQGQVAEEGPSKRRRAPVSSVVARQETAALSFQAHRENVTALSWLLPEKIFSASLGEIFHWE